MPFVPENSMVAGWHLSGQVTSQTQPIASQDNQLTAAALLAGVEVLG